MLILKADYSLKTGYTYVFYINFLINRNQDGFPDFSVPQQILKSRRYLKYYNLLNSLFHTKTDIKRRSCFRCLQGIVMSKLPSKPHNILH